MRPFRDLAFDQLAVSVVVDFLVAKRNDQRTVGAPQSVSFGHWSFPLLKPDSLHLRPDRARPNEGSRHIPAPGRLSQPARSTRPREVPSGAGGSLRKASRSSTAALRRCPPVRWAEGFRMAALADARRWTRGVAS